MGLRDRAKEMATKAADRAKETGWKDREPEPVEAIFVGTSRDEGKNATVTLYRDRIERVKERGLASLSRARQDTEVTPVRSVSSVQAKKAGFRTNVTVYASGNTIEFRFGHDEAQQFKDALMALILGEGSAPAASSADEITRLATLRDQGVLSAEEFDAAKRKALGL